ncbi:hypothetical protein NT2_05_02710 [Caenibius tardaugens NBRC 16725]|uniref:DUF1761 domain-containing protein n=1 Tax=Caenibius tardaugens NBRC 16725 TaxID=1219035 RepID=U2Y831_9SPHN|nr:DUF1761 domain-containing protein [Caenibius tardaugens]AZI36690.1 DUF1761 domain-containing protein [Caenibius tardaugens NBRC 16725]GAD49351.1 hypothetical protein NT2_05_02710 [Caenibius tardaugens NBRC 16725]
MGPVNWIAVAVAALAALVVAGLWYGPLFGRAKLEEVGPGRMASRTSTGRTGLTTVILLLLTAAMMGHMFARVGVETLAMKPWLYFMMSGGLALFFVIPALSLSYMHQRLSTRLGMIDGGYWLAAYLAMGLVFWLLG